MNVALLVAIVGLLSLVAAEWFGSWNLKKYLSEKDQGIADRDAFKRNRRRKALYNRIAFWILVLAAGLSIYSAFSERRESDESIKSLTSRLADAETRIQSLQQQSEHHEAQAQQLQTRLTLIEGKLPDDQASAATDRIASVERDNKSLERRVRLLEGKLHKPNTRSRK